MRKMMHDILQFHFLKVFCNNKTIRMMKMNDLKDKRNVDVNKYYAMEIIYKSLVKRYHIT